MVALAVQQLSMNPATTQTTSVPDIGGSEGTPANTVPPGDRVFLEFENSNAATRTITIYVPATAGLDAYGTSFPDLTYTLAATTGRRRIGPLDPRFAGPTGLIGFTIDANAGVTVAAIRN